ncbi:MAG: sugar phosphate isomerase/epimerase family protein [Verrucomicrobiota bacterium]
MKSPILFTAVFLGFAGTTLSDTMLAVMETAFGNRCAVESIAMTREAGYAGVQLHTGSLDENSVLTISDKELQAGFLAEVKKHGVEIISLCAGSMNKINVWQPGESREQGLAIMKQSLEACEVLDCDLLLFPFFGASNFQEGEEKIAGVVEFIREILPFAEKHGVTLGIESPVTYERVLELFDRLGNPDNVLMYYDTGNMLRGGEDIYQAISDLGNDRICEIHIKPQGDIHFGKDETDYQKLADSLDEIGYNKWFVFEARGGLDKENPTALAIENRKGIERLLSLRKPSE